MEIPMSKPEFEKVHIKEGFYQGTLKEVKEVSPGKYGDRLALIFEVQHDKEGILELAKVVYKKITPGSALMNVMEVFGFEWKEGDNFETDKLIGKKATVVVESYIQPDGEKASTISKVKPIEEVKEEKVEDD